MNIFDQPAPTGRRLVLNIDRVVLRGFAPAERAAMTEALQTELARMLADPATRARLVQRPRVNAVRLSNLPFVPGPAGGRSLGRRIAAGITGPAAKGARP